MFMLYPFLTMLFFTARILISPYPKRRTLAAVTKIAPCDILTKIAYLRFILPPILNRSHHGAANTTGLEHQNSLRKPEAWLLRPTQTTPSAFAKFHHSPKAGEEFSTHLCQVPSISLKLEGNFPLTFAKSRQFPSIGGVARSAKVVAFCQSILQCRLWVLMLRPWPTQPSAA
jgi:hypothetical protein